MRHERRDPETPAGPVAEIPVRPIPAQRRPDETMVIQPTAKPTIGPNASTA